MKKKIRIKSFHNNNKELIESMTDHTRGCIAIASTKGKDDIKKNDIKKGMVLVSNPELARNICFRFEGIVKILTTKSFNIESGRSCIHFHCGTISQSTRFEKIYDNETSKLKKVLMKFKYNPEFIEPFQLFVFRNGQVQGVGVITRIIPVTEDENPVPDSVKKHKVYNFNRKDVETHK